jgi:hypothetical protein
MDISEFYDKYKSKRQKKIIDICDKWEKEKVIDDFLGTTISSGVMISDLLIGDGSLDQISPELKQAFEGLMKEKADSYSKIRQILYEKLEKGDNSVLGTVNKIKGQVGEEFFKQQCEKEGIVAQLAESGNQEGWDVYIENSDGVAEYVQVKMYSDAGGVIQHVKKIQDKIKEGSILGQDGLPIEKIKFAVPIDISYDLKEKISNSGYDVEVVTIPMSSEEAANVVVEGFNNVGPEAISNLFSELLVSTASVAALNAMANAFLIYKESKDTAAALADISKSTATSAVGIGLGMTTELLLNKVSWVGGPPTAILTFAVSFSSRAILKRVLQRGGSIIWIKDSIGQLEHLTVRLQEV